MRVNGLDLFDYRSPNGRSLRLAYDRIVGWVHDPTTFPYDKSALDPGGYRYLVGYWEILNARWPNPEADAVLDYRRPLKDDAMSVGMTFTHGAG